MISGFSDYEMEFDRDRYWEGSFSFICVPKERSKKEAEVMKATENEEKLKVIWDLIGETDIDQDKNTPREQIRLLTDLELAGIHEIAKQ